MPNKNTTNVKSNDSIVGRWCERLKNIIAFKSNSEDKEPKDSQPIQTRPPKIGLALGCGGAKSLAHIGVLKVLEENNIPIHAIAGTSMGSYIGALWATGHTTEQMQDLAAEMMEKDALKKLADPIIPPIKGIFQGKKVRAHLHKSIGCVNFDKLERNLLVVAANLNNYERVVFRKGRDIPPHKVLDAVHASCAMPGIIVPVEIDGKRLVDGGVADPVPVGALSKFSDVDYIIAVSTTPTLEEIDTLEEATATAEREDGIQKSWWQSKKSLLNRKLNPAAEGNMLDNLSRSLTISQIRLAYDACKRADIAIQPVSRGSRWHEYSEFEKFIERGERATRQHLTEILKLTEPIPIEPTEPDKSNKHNETTDQHMVGDRIA